MRDVAGIAQNPRHQNPQSLALIRLVGHVTGQHARRRDRGDSRIESGRTDGDQASRSNASDQDFSRQAAVPVVHGVQQAAHIHHPLAQQRASQPQRPLGRIVIGRAADPVMGLSDLARGPQIQRQHAPAAASKCGGQCTVARRLAGVQIEYDRQLLICRGQRLLAGREPQSRLRLEHNRADLTVGLGLHERLLSCCGPLGVAKALRQSLQARRSLRLPLLDVLGRPASFKQPARLGRGELRDRQKVVGPRLAGKTPQRFGIFCGVLRFRDRRAVARFLQMTRHPTVHGLAHRLVVIVRRFEDGVLHMVGTAVQFEDRPCHGN